jgi:hypothetical protein
MRQINRGPSPVVGLDRRGQFGEIAPAQQENEMATGRRINWLNVSTVASAAILIGAEVFGAAFAGSWALATLLELGTAGQRILDVAFVLVGLVVMAQFVRFGNRIEPFTKRG